MGLTVPDAFTAYRDLADEDDDSPMCDFGSTDSHAVEFLVGGTSGGLVHLRWVGERSLSYSPER